MSDDLSPGVAIVTRADVAGSARRGDGNGATASLLDLLGTVLVADIVSLAQIILAEWQSCRGLEPLHQLVAAGVDLLQRSLQRFEGV